MMKDLPACRVWVAADGGHNSEAASTAPRRGRDLVETTVSYAALRWTPAESEGCGSNAMKIIAIYCQ